MATSHSVESYQLSTLFFTAILWLIIFVVAVFAIRFLFANQWRQLYATVYPEFATISRPEATTNLDMIAPIVASPPPATASAVFIDHLIQAILEASSPAEASSEAAEMLSQL